MEAILKRLNNLPTEHGFPANARPFIFQEVIDLGGEPIGGDEYFHIGRVTEFKFSKGIGEVFRGYTALKNLANFGEGWGMYPSGSALAFVDNHDNQRGHGAGGDTILTYKDSRQYKLATAFKLAWPYSVTRIMSSFDFSNTDTGPPNTNGNTNPVPLNPDGTCAGGWVCEHRWRQIFNMVEFRNVVEGTGVNDWWDNGGNQIGFCRGDKGFIAFNTEGYELNRQFQTCLPPGTYCDVISGYAGSVDCSGKYVIVGSGGLATIVIPSSDPDPVIAIHVNARIN
jgi:alpha-amylase